jgi:hypothetical protein
MLILDPGSGFFSIQGPEVKKAPDPGSGSATLVVNFVHTGNQIGRQLFLIQRIIGKTIQYKKIAWF